MICYRCGEATTAPRVAPPPATPERGPVPVIIAILIIIAAGVVVLPELAPGTPRYAGWAALVVVTAAAVWRLRPRSRGRLRGRS